MRVLLFILACLGLISCDPQEQLGVYYMSGFYNASTDSAAIRAFYLDENNRISADISWNFFLSGTGNESMLTKVDDLLFTSGNLPEWQGKVTLRSEGDHEMYSSVVIPPIIEAISQSAQEILIDPNDLNEEVLTLSWNSAGQGYSYLLQLQPLDEPLSPIPFEGGFFDEQFNGPMEENSITLISSDFEFYGSHKLTVYVIPEVYKNLFFFQGRGLGFLAEEGPDNVTGGKGVFTAVRSLDFTFEVTP